MKLLQILTLSLISVTAAPLLAAPKTDSGQSNTAQTAATNADAHGDSRSFDLNERGVAAVKARDLKQAEEHFRKSLALDPKNLTAVINLAAVYMTVRRVPEATAPSETILKVWISPVLPT